MLVAGGFIFGIVGAAVTTGLREGRAPVEAEPPAKIDPPAQLAAQPAPVTKTYALDYQSCVGDSVPRSCGRHSVLIKVQDNWLADAADGTIVVVPNSHFVRTKGGISKEYFTEGNDDGISFTIISRFSPFHDIHSYSITETADNGCEAQFSFEGNNINNPEASYVAEISDMACRRIK